MDYLQRAEVDTLYFGGGTPTLFSPAALSGILSAVVARFRLSSDPEITIEANPDDLDLTKLKQLRQSGFNRISIGIQSFMQDHLELMNRRHTVRQAVQAVYESREAGFDNISIDLIYGIPGMSSDEWRLNLEQAAALPVDHISAYHLSIEKGTRFNRWRRQGLLREVTEEESVAQYQIIDEVLAASGFEWYEISNLARNGRYSRHNMKYWNGSHYLGLGPSAHSFNGVQRHWNVASLPVYLTNMDKGILPEGESIERVTAFNEFIMTRLRTVWGIRAQDYKDVWGDGEWTDLCRKAEKFITSGDMEFTGDVLRFTRSGWFRSDGILARLFAG
jgi:oxygen-independent coproporphyrinogen-3 oxidase